MKLTNILFFTFLLSYCLGQAQSKTDRAHIIEQSNVDKLKAFADSAQRSYNSGMERARLKSVSETFINANNKIGFLSGFDHDGNPVYDFDDNAEVAITLRVDKIWDGGISGLDLDGTGIVIGHWEAGGLARKTHQELEGRIIHAEAEPVSSHATHTAGTMIAAGIKPKARGMASGATIESRKSNNDESEMANFALAGGILSNHSYSTGNPDGDIPKYGRYNSNAAEWDEIMYNAPYLLICKSAGNNRNDGVNEDDNGYDIIYTVAGSKNVLTIGAVYDVLEYTKPSDVDQSSFSNWGPTDDWRIKPDITTSGMNVYSPDDGHNSDYADKSGSSMSTAAVSGSIALLQQHYHNLNGVYMKSATAKALLICTTDEVGTHDGPDFQSGWGLLNAERAAELISNNGRFSSIAELRLTNYDAYAVEVEVDGQTELSLALAWTDPAGPSMTGKDNQLPVLVNDLDVKIMGNNTVYRPWVLTPNLTSDNFTDGATKGDNFRDNVERIDAGILPAGKYIVKVTHKDVLQGGFQDFALVINGITKSPVSVNKVVMDNRLNVYPQPCVNGTLNIRVSDSLKSEEYHVKVFSMQGILVKSKISTSENIELDVANLMNGTYIVSVQTEHSDYRKVVIIGR